MALCSRGTSSRDFNLLLCDWSNGNIFFVLNFLYTKIKVIYNDEIRTEYDEKFSHALKRSNGGVRLVERGCGSAT